MAQNETDLWTLNRLACGPWTGFQIGHFRVFFGFPHFAWNPYFYSVFVQIPIYDVKMLGTNWSKFQTLKNQFEQGSGRFVVPEPALKMGPRNQARTTKKETPKKCEQHKTKRFFLQNGAFSDKKKLKLFFLMALGCWLFCGQRPVMTTAKKHYKTRGFVVFVVVFLLLVVAPTATT